MHTRRMWAAALLLAVFTCGVGSARASLSDAEVLSLYPNGIFVDPVVSGNDNDLAAVEAKILDYLFDTYGTMGDLTLDYYGKYDVDEDRMDFISGADELHLSITFAADVDDNAAGGWAVTPPPNPAPEINFYSLKAGDQWALYAVDPAASWGTWNTVENLDSKSLSHFSAWIWTEEGGGSGGDPVPEPSTLLIVGAGLLLAARWRRRRAVAVV